MKNSIKLFLTVLLVTMTGCYDHLDREPIGLITQDQIDTEPTESTIVSSVNSIYQPLSTTLNILGQWDWGGGKVVRNDFVVYDIASGDMLKKWEPDGDQPWMDEVAAFNFTSNNAAFNGVWSYNYEGISRANLAINTLEDSEIIGGLNIDQALVNRLRGEAYFLRAFNYFELVTNFGDVPLLTEPLENFSDAYDVAIRAPEEEVWNLISEDLETAVQLLPVRKYSSESEPWRVSLGAALAYQAKVALFRENYSEVINIVSAIESHEFYSLNDHYFDSFDVSRQFQENEVIFAYDHRENETPGRGNGLGALMGWGFIAPSNDFLESFEPDDPRLEYTVDDANRYVHKLLGTLDGQFKGNSDSPGNKIYIRYADVLLWKAEALIETGDTEAGLQIIDQVRDRARNTPKVGGTTVPPDALPSYAGTGLSQMQARKVLRHERKVELGFESHRFNDLKRWGIAREVLTEMGKNFHEHNYLYPVPQGEIDRSGGQIHQNPGY